jgi:hypothetical protein
MSATERERLIAEANRAHTRYPQYVGHWDSWVVGTITRRVKTKGGVRFEAGDRVLVDPLRHDAAYSLSDESRSAYSWRGQVDVSVPREWVRLS